MPIVTISDRSFEELSRILDAHLGNTSFDLSALFDKLDENSDEVVNKLDEILNNMAVSSNIAIIDKLDEINANLDRMAYTLEQIGTTKGLKPKKKK